MPLNVPLVDTFAPSRDAFGQLQNALASGPAFQMNKLKLGAAQDERAELRELQQLMAQTPQEKRPEVAIQYLESKGHVEEAAKLRHVRQQLFDQLYERDPQAATRQFPELGVDANASNLKVGDKIAGTRNIPYQMGGKRGFMQAEQTPEEMQKEAEFKARGSMLGGVKTPEQLQSDVTQAGALEGAKETAKQAARPDKTVERTVDLGDKVEYIYVDGTREVKKKGVSPNTIVQVDNKRDQRDFRNESAMRQEFTKLPEVKQFQTIDSQMSRAQKAMEEAAKPGAKMLAVDQTLITVLNKMLDPSSVVRESEYARTPNDQAFLDRIKGKIEKIQSGGAGLTPEERKALTVMINNFYQVAKGQYDEQVKFYGDMAGRYGYSAENVVRLGGKASGFAAQVGGGETKVINGVTYKKVQGGWQKAQ